MNLKYFSQIKKVIILAIKFLKERTILVFVILLFIFIFLAGLIFYQYAYKAVYSIKEMSVKGLKINQELFQKITSRFQEKEKNIQEKIDRVYPNPFR